MYLKADFKWGRRASFVIKSVTHRVLYLPPHPLAAGKAGSNAATNHQGQVQGPLLAI
jgi:hypothetical protein